MRTPEPKQSIWQFIPLSDYESPSEPPTEQIRTSLLGLWERVRRGTTTVTPASKDLADQDQEDLHQDVDSLAPWPNWIEQGANALDEALSDWCAQPHAEAACRLIVAPPFCRVEAMLEHWANRHNYRLLQPPTTVQILKNPDEWLDQLHADSLERFVLVGLERCYLRHYNGLTLVRRLVRRLWQEKLPCVLGCDSWAWAYLDFSCHLGMLDRNPLTLAPLDAPAISRWIDTFSPPATGPQPAADPISPVYRRTDDGVRVFPIHARSGDPDDFDLDETDDLTSEFLIHVAAHARGIPGVVWALWRKSMMIADRGIIKDKARKVARTDSRPTVWIRKWESVALPAIPTHLGDTGAFALHAILLHSGLSFEEIEYLVPGSSLELAHDLRALERAGILEETQGRFYVTPVGYPTARAFLSEESFMTDAL